MKHTLCIALTAGMLFQLFADTEIRTIAGNEKEINKKVFGVNQLAYGRDSYGFLQPGKKTVQPELIEILKQMGVRSMRYPGGCGGTHNFDWKQSAGLRGKYPFLGLIEFLNACEKIGAEPILGLSAYRGTPREAAEFVEFLNAPNDGKSKWAAKRAKLGHPAPYNVRYVEYGNEVYHGNHYTHQTVLQEQYALNYLTYRNFMKAVDPKIQLGLSISGEWWSRPIFQIVGDNFDFIVRHYYHNMRLYPSTEYIRNFETVKDRFKAERLEEILKLHPSPKWKTPRFAITEFNSSSKFKHTLTAALQNAELIQEMCVDPNIITAECWQFINESFGMVRGRKPGEFVKRPNALMFELFSGHLLDRWIPIEITGRMTPVKTEKLKLDEKERSSDLAENLCWKQMNQSPHVSMSILPGGILRTDVLCEDNFNLYHVGAVFPCRVPGDSRSYRLTAEIRVEGLKNSTGATLQFGDGRGWDMMKSISRTVPEVSSGEWTPVSAVYDPLPDTKSLEIKVRKSGPGKGSIFIRNVKVHPFIPESVSKRVVTGMLSASKDGKSLALVLTNRSFDPEKVSFDLKRGSSFRGSVIKNASAKSLTGPDAYADNEKKADNVSIAPQNVTVKGSCVETVLPPHSLTGILIQLSE